MTILYDTPETEVEDPSPPGPKPVAGFRAFVVFGWVLAVLVFGLGVLSWLSGRAELAEEQRILVTDANNAVLLLDPAEPEPVYTIEDAVPSPDRSRLFQLVEDNNGGTVLNEFEAGTGEIVETRVIAEPSQEIRIVSPDGDALALMPRRAATAELYVPEARSETSVTVVWRDVEEPATFDLVGNFEPEAFTRDGQTLYLLEFWPAEAPERYFVRSLDLETGEIADTFSPEVDLNPEMRGHARAQVIDPDGEFLYTLYTLDAVGEPVTDPNAEVASARWAFIHVISLTEDWSFCIFLPSPMGRSEATTGLAVTPGGGTLYAVDAAADRIVSIDTTTMKVRDAAELRGWESPTGQRLPMAAGPDGSVYVVLDEMVVRYNSQLAPVSVWRAGTLISSIDISPDGKSMRVSIPGFVKVVDVESGEETSAIGVPGNEAGVDFVGPPLNPNSFTERLSDGEPVPKG